MASVLANETKVRGFNPNQKRRSSKGDKNRQYAFFLAEVKSSAPCPKILRHVKNTFQVWTKILCKAKFIISFAQCLLLCYSKTAVGFSDNPCGRIRFPCRIFGQPLWTNQIPLPISFHHESQFSYITWVTSSGRSWKKWSSDMMTMMITIMV
jgi:hypothetical protein